MIFIDNKYTRVYYQIVERAKDRTLIEYTEIHHIVPKSLGGDNSKDNLVSLTAREHFICHWLLTKMTNGLSKQKMSYALHAMLHLNLDKRYKNSIAYEKNKIECAEYRSSARKGILIGSKNYNYGKKWSEEQRAKMRGHTRNVGRKRQPLTEESKEKMRISANKRWSNEERALQSARKLASMLVFECPHCKKQINGKPNYTRWHGDNCKSINS